MATPIKTRTPQLGLNSDAVEGAVNILTTTLANLFTLRLKLRKYHWNVTGPQFRSLHELFEEQYTTLATTIDEVAERLRSYGDYAPGTLSEFSEHTRIEENPRYYPDAKTMVEHLVDDHEMLIRLLREDITVVAEQYNDVGLEDFLTSLLQKHQEMAWILRSFLGDDSL